MVNKLSSVPLYEQIQNTILNEIRSGTYEPGTQVPSELEIAGHYEVSRMTARKALDNLVSKGFLYRRKGKGTYVSENIVSYGLSSMMSFSQTLEAQGYKVNTRILMKEILPAAPEVARSLQLNVGDAVIVIRRLRYVQDLPAAIHASYFDHQVCAVLMKIDLNTESLLQILQREIGIRVAYSMDSVQADVANPEETKLLELNNNISVLRLHGIAYSENGQPTRLIHAVYRGDMFRLMVKNTAEMAASFRIRDMSDVGTEHVD